MQRLASCDEHGWGQSVMQELRSGFHSENDHSVKLFWKHTAYCASSDCMSFPSTVTSACFFAPRHVCVRSLVNTWSLSSCSIISNDIHWALNRVTHSRGIWACVHHWQASWHGYLQYTDKAASTQTHWSSCEDYRTKRQMTDSCCCLSVSSIFTTYLHYLHVSSHL